MQCARLLIIESHSQVVVLTLWVGGWTYLPTQIYLSHCTFKHVCSLTFGVYISVCFYLNIIIHVNFLKCYLLYVNTLYYNWNINILL